MGSKLFGFGDYDQAAGHGQEAHQTGSIFGEMVKVVPWNARIDLIQSHYPKTSSNVDCTLCPLATMLRIHVW
jgi:hypothetical protein